ncbi:glycosyltransferase family 2 protein [Rickettsiales bacterium]|nr:glycosyltransferase family 2 protein [Rickettsiales bacterium]
MSKTKTSAKKKKLLSIIAPIYNEAENLEAFFDNVIEKLKATNLDWEIICINDSSTDNSLELLHTFRKKNSKIKIISFSRNFGKEAALTAGLKYANGDAAIPIDTDLQDPPDIIIELVKKWQEGFKVVNAKRKSRNQESWLKRSSADCFYKFISGIASVKIPSNVGDFRLIDRKVIDVINKMPERTRFMKGIFAWPGFDSATIEYERPQRHKGNSSWNYWKLWQFALDGIISFSTLPLKIWTYIGTIISAIALIYASILVARTLVFGIDVPGYASIMTAVLFIGGIQLIGLGVIGEYVGRIYKETKHRPIYVIEEQVGFDNEK